MGWLQNWVNKKTIINHWRALEAPPARRCCCYCWCCAVVFVVVTSTAQTVAQQHTEWWIVCFVIWNSESDKVGLSSYTCRHTHTYKRSVIDDSVDISAFAPFWQRVYYQIRTHTHTKSMYKYMPMPMPMHVCDSIYTTYTLDCVRTCTCSTYFLLYLLLFYFFNSPLIFENFNFNFNRNKIKNDISTFNLISTACFPKKKKSPRPYAAGTKFYMNGWTQIRHTLFPSIKSRYKAYLNFCWL